MLNTFAVQLQRANSVEEEKQLGRWTDCRTKVISIFQLCTIPSYTIKVIKKILLKRLDTTAERIMKFCFEVIYLRETM